MKCVVKKTGAVGEIIGTIRDEGTEKVVFANGLIIPSEDVLPVFPPTFDNGGLSEVKADAYETARHLGVVPFLDGNSWCALYGPNIQEGICGFGDTPESAILKFYDEFVGRNKE